MKKICVNTLASSPERERRIREAARRHGYEVELIEQEQFDPGRLADCEILFGNVPPSYLAAATSLRWFQSNFAGVNAFFEAKALEGREFLFTKAAGGYGISIAEHVLAMTLALFRRLPDYCDHQKAHRWQIAGKVRSIYGARAVVVGLGDIGSNLAVRLKALGAHVVGVRRTQGEMPPYLDEMFSADRLAEALPGAEILALCVPATPKTRQMIGRAQLELVSEQCVVVNVGRGAVLDQEALVDALCAHKIAGAGLDVTTPEPLPPESPLWEAPNIIITPHTSGNYTLELSCDRVVDIFLDNLERYVSGQPLHNLVNLGEQY